MVRVIKVVMVGASGTGKTSLRGQYISGTFSENYRATIGTDFIARTLPIAPTSGGGLHSSQGEFVTLQIWDTAGQERFSSLAAAFFRGADAVILVYDVSRPETLNDLKRWWDTFVEKCPVPPGEEMTWPIAIVGNKTDLVPSDQREVSAASTFVKTLVPVPDLEEEIEEQPPTPPPAATPSIRTISASTPTTNGLVTNINILGTNHNGRIAGSSATLNANGTLSSVRSGHTIYHTPSSSVGDRSSFNGSMHTAHESTPAPSEHSSPLGRRSTFASLSSSSPTITPSLYTRLGRGDSDDDDDEGVLTGDSTPIQEPSLERGAQLFFASAKTGEGVSEVFAYIAARTTARMKWVERVEARTLHLAEGSLSGPAANSQGRSFRLGDLIREPQAWQVRCCS